MIHRTLLVTQSFSPEHSGGIERTLDAICNNVDPSRIVVIAPPSSNGPSGDPVTPYTVIYKDLLKHTFARPAWLFRLPWFLATVRAQRATRVLFGHYAGWVSLGALTKLITGTPYAAMFHGLDFLSYRTSMMRRFLLRWNVRLAEWIIVNSSYTYSLLKDFGVPEGKLVIAYATIGKPVFVEARAVTQFIAQYNLDPQRTLLTVGRLVARKGLARVINAMPEILTRYPDANYVIVGDGPERASLERLAHELHVEEHVRFLGRVSDRDRDLAYAASCAFIMLPVASSRDVEGFGLVYIEALARGCPIIATRSAGVIDIIRDDNGIALDEQADTHAVADAVNVLFGDSARAAKLAAQGRTFVEQTFSVERFKQTFSTILAAPEQPTRPIRVSVIIPAWNSVETLPRTLHSIALQTWKDTEVIVVDDGSIDDPKMVCDQFPGVRFIRKDHGGAPAARNRGFSESTGEYVLFCDADVMLHPRMIERMVTTLELKPDASYAYCSFRFGWRTFDLFDFDEKRLKQSNYICTMSLIRRKDFPGFDESIKRLQDWDLWLTMLAQGKRGVWVPARLFSSSVGKKGISARLKMPPQEAVRIVRQKHHLG